MRAIVVAGVACAALVLSGAAAAHVMQVPYTLPVPFWLYAYGATGALLASFVIVGYFVRADTAATASRVFDVSRAPVFRALAQPFVVATLRVLTVAAFALAIASGLFGTRYPTANFNITFFWVVFALGFTYVVAIAGDMYPIVGPWRVLCDWIERVAANAFRGRVRYPSWLAYYPALAFYMAFIWIELFGGTVPRSLSLILAAYTGINIAGAWLFGRDAWFRYAELFSVFFRMIGMQAPVEYRCARDQAARSMSAPANARPDDRQRDHASASAGGHVTARAPFMGLLERPAEHFSLLLFVLFMLSSTAFDGMHETVPWVGIFWKQIYPLLASFIAKGDPQQYLVLVEFFYYWQWLMLFVSPFIYLAIYLFFIALTKWVTRSRLSMRELALRFTFSLIPIAFVYNVTHYFTLLFSQGPFIVPLLADPFGFGWNLFGMKSLYEQPFMFEAGTVWHTQVSLILFGHIVSVYLSHVEALKVFQSTRKAAVSQVPLLLLMMMLTTIGLWILSLPIAAGQVLLPPATPS